MIYATLLFLSTLKVEILTRRWLVRQIYRKIKLNIPLGLKNWLPSWIGDFWIRVRLLGIGAMWIFVWKRYVRAREKSKRKWSSSCWGGWKNYTAKHSNFKIQLIKEQSGYYSSTFPSSTNQSQIFNSLDVSLSFSAQRSTSPQLLLPNHMLNAVFTSSRRSNSKRRK